MSEGGGGKEGGLRRSGRKREECVLLHDQGHSWSSGKKEEDSKPRADSDGIKLGEEYKGRDKAGEGESSEEEKDEEMDGNGFVSGIEKDGVQKVTVDHEVYISSSSCFC